MFTSKCPRCEHDLVVKQLSCENCALEMSGIFPMSKFDYLSDEELKFIESFLVAQGSFKAIQEDWKMSYPAAKKKYAEILTKLGLAEFNIANDDTAVQPISTQDSLVVQTIKAKLNENNGRARIPQFQGDIAEIGFDPSGTGLVSDKIPVPNQLTWPVFDAAVEIVMKSGGRAPKGNARAGKLGTTGLPVDSVEGFIAQKVHGAKIGDSAFGPGFIVAAVLDWADICRNTRGYLEIVPGFQSRLLTDK